MHSHTVWDHVVHLASLLIGHIYRSCVLTLCATIWCMCHLNECQASSRQRREINGENDTEPNKNDNGRIHKRCNSKSEIENKYPGVCVSPGATAQIPSFYGCAL